MHRLKETTTMSFLATSNYHDVAKFYLDRIALEKASPEGELSNRELEIGFSAKFRD